MTYLLTNSVHLSALANRLIGGMLHEMLSSRAYRCQWWVTVEVLDVMFGVMFGDWDHCRECYEHQREMGIYDL
jgi:ribosomal protein S19